jgi:translation initiation factor 2B subunit (eIF-2B alpha/beta/delta family)
VGIKSTATYSPPEVCCAPFTRWVAAVAGRHDSTEKESFMATRKKATSKVQKDIRTIGRTLERLGAKLVGDATIVALDAAERTLIAAHKKLQKVRAQVTKLPT